MEGALRPVRLPSPEVKPLLLLPKDASGGTQTAAESVRRTVGLEHFGGPEVLNLLRYGDTFLLY